MIEIILLIVAIYLYVTYVSLIKAKNKPQEAYASVDVQLKKRYDLIPNILTIASKFMEHEKGLLEEIVKLRSEAMNVSKDIQQSEKKFELENQINSKLGQFMMAVENYPQLKSDVTMVNAMNAYMDVEEHIATARRFYNSAVLELNNRAEIFTSSIFALMLSIKRQPFFEIDEAQRKSINASDYLK